MFDLDLNITNGTVSKILTTKKLREILKSWKKDHNNIFFTLMLLHVLYVRSLKSEWPRCSFFYILNNVPWSPVTRFHVGWLLTGGKNSSVVLVCHPVTERKKNQYSLFILSNSTLCLSRFKLPVLNVYCNYFFFHFCLCPMNIFSW